MADTAARLFRLLDELQASGHATTAALASRLRVSERTVRRDLVRLADLEVPVTVTPGRGGGVRLAPGALLAPLRFTDAELIALLLGARSVERTGDSALARSSASARRRLEAVLTPRAHARARALEAALVTAPERPPAVASGPVDGAAVLEVAEAVHDDAQLVLRYAAPNARETRRVVDPYGLVRLEHWYLAAYCHLRRGMRTFRLDRVRRVERNGTTFERPEGVDAYALVTASLATAPMPGSVLCRVTLDTDLETASRHVPATEVVLLPHPAGVMLSTRAYDDGLEALALHLLWLPWPCTVEEPDALRHAFGRVAQRALTLAAGRRPHSNVA